MRLAILLLSCTVVVSGANNAGFAATGPERDERSTLERYEGNLEFAIMSCQLELRIANTSAQISELKGNDGAAEKSKDWRGCIRTQKVIVKNDYEALLKGVKKSSARAALKEHFIQATQALSGIAPYANETATAHSKRQGDNKAKLDELWTRFELEK